MALFFSLSGLRGTVGEEITPELVTAYGRAFGTYVKHGSLVLGRDARRSSEMLLYAVASGILGAGTTGINLGVVPTPTVLIMIPKLRAQGGIVVTASHNPLDWNGLKFISPSGSFLNKREFERFQRILKKKNVHRVRPEQPGTMYDHDRARETHLEQILSHRFVKKAPAKKMKVGIDAVNGAASLFAPELLRRLGAEVDELYCTPDGTSPRPPEPVEKHLTDLGRFVTERHLDIGFAFDPDGDRLACVDETGSPIGEERTLALATAFVLAKSTGPVVINLSTSRMSEDIARERGVAVYRTAIGEANVVATMRNVSALIGGEGNGGVIFPEINYGRDGLVAAAFILTSLLEQGQPLSKLAAQLPEYHMVKVKVRYQKFDLRKVKKIFKGKKIDETDGVRVEDGDSWLHIRASKTEPVIRIIAEARTHQQAHQLVAETVRLLGLR